MPDSSITMGILLWSQATDWPSFARAARKVDELGYAHLWTWDHLLPIFGDLRQPIFEGWVALGALGALTSRAKVGLLVGANTFRNPALVAKAAVTLDHVTGGRAILGLGGAWFEPEHTAYGIEFGQGSAERLDWLDEAVGLIRRLVDGEEVSHDGRRYRTQGLRLDPGPVQTRLPLLIGGVGERKTLRTVARYADLWNAYGSPEVLRGKIAVLHERCAEVGRDPATIEAGVAFKPFIRDTEREARRVLEQAMAHNRTPVADVKDDPAFWVGTPTSVAERIAELRQAGFKTFIGQIPAPYDEETLERFIGEVKPMIEVG